MKKASSGVSELTSQPQVGSSEWLEAQVARMLACDGSCGWYDATEYLKVRTAIRDYIGQERIDCAHDEMRF